MDFDICHTKAEKKIAISHIRQSDMEVQTNEEHQQGVARLTEHFAGKFGMGELGFLTGLLHDKGKEQMEWQKYIQGVTGYNKDYANVISGPNHSYVGAIEKRCDGAPRKFEDYTVTIDRDNLPSGVNIEEMI